MKSAGWAGAVKLISVVTFLANCLTLFVRCRVIMTDRAAAASYRYPGYPRCLTNSRYTKPPKLVLTRQCCTAFLAELLAGWSGGGSSCCTVLLTVAVLWLYCIHICIYLVAALFTLLYLFISNKGTHGVVRWRGHMHINLHNSLTFHHWCPSLDPCPVSPCY